MNKKFTKLLAALALLVFMTPSLAMWGQTRTTVTDHMTAANLSATSTSYVNFSNVSLESDAVYAGNSAREYLNSQYNIQLRSNNSNSGIVTTTSGGSITSITITVAHGTNTIDVYGKNTAYSAATDLYNSNTQGTKIGSLSSTGTINVTDSYAYVGIRSKSGAIYLSSIDFVWEEDGGSAVATTTTIDASNITNTDVYVSTAAGSLTATVTETESGNAISGAIVTWSSSDTDVATIDNDGTVTLVAVGTTTITASYAGESGVYGLSFATYELTVTSSEPYVQPTEIEITPNYNFWGKTGQFSGNDFSELEGSKDNVTLNWTKGSGSMYANTTAMRFYKDNTLEFSAPTGYEIISIELTISGTYNDLTFSPTGYDNATTTWTGAAETVTMSRPSNASSYAQISKFTITLATPSTDPSITISPATITAPYQGTSGTLTMTIENITGEYSTDIQFCDANGDELEGDDPDWVFPAINESAGTVGYTINANNGEARIAYFMVYALIEGEGNDYEEVYSNIITVNQAAAPAPSITVTPNVVNVDATPDDVIFEGTLGITYENLTISDMSDFGILYYDAEGGEISTGNEPLWIDVLVAEQDPNIGEGYVVSYTILENEGEARTARFKVFAFDANDDPVYSNLVTVNQAAYVAPPTPGTWVLTSLAELTEDDIFVIVGTDNDIETSYALPNDKGTSTPDAVVVYVVDNTLSGEPDARLQWNISGNATNGYTFYPNGSTETWLYCTASNDGVRVGTNSNKTFTFVDGSNNSYTNQAHYLFNTATSRYVGVYTTNPDWRCYTSVNNNICNQSFAFYKKVVEPATETYTLDIAQYTSKENGWYLIASPVSVDLTTNDMVSGTYDLYRFNPTAELEWENYKATENNEPLHTDFTTLEVGRGYLYANGNDGGIQLSFTGVPSNNGQVNMPYAGWNLVGNPLSTAATITNDYYRMNDTHTGIMTEAGTGNIALMEGVFVQAVEAGQTVTFTPAQSGNNNGKSAVEINLSQNRGGVIDRAIVRFGNSNTLPKLQLFENSTKIYIAQDGEDYAIVNAEAQGEMPINFRANEDGQYTLTVNPKNVDMNYLHLIDNMTGMDVDLLQTPSYTFNATTRDYESRFRLVFAANNEDGPSTGSGTFAFYSNGNWIINNAGEATLQVVDLTGRILSSETVNGSVSTTINAVPGVYMLRLINGENVNVQKIVVR